MPTGRAVWSEAGLHTAWFAVGGPEMAHLDVANHPILVADRLS